MRVWEDAQKCALMSPLVLLASRRAAWDPFAPPPPPREGGMLETIGEESVAEGNVWHMQHVSQISANNVAMKVDLGREQCSFWASATEYKIFTWKNPDDEAMSWTQLIKVLALNFSCYPKEKLRFFIIIFVGLWMMTLSKCKWYMHIFHVVSLDAGGKKEHSFV